MQILRAKEKTGILEWLEKQYGITKLPYLLLRFGREKIREEYKKYHKEILVPA